MPHHHPFQESFWSPTASIDRLPNFQFGFNVLHSKLTQSLAENKAITEFIQQRIAAEREHAATLAEIIVPDAQTPFDNDIGSSLKQCFQVVRNESTATSQEHCTRAEDLHTTVLDPLQQFSSRYERIITQAKQTVETQLDQFQAAYKAMEQAKTFYSNKCKTLMMVQPDFTMATTVKLGNTLFSTRNHVWAWLDQLLVEDDVYTKQQLINVLKDDTDAHDEALVLDSLVELGFLKIENDAFTKQSRNNHDVSIANNKRFSGFLGRWSGNHSKKEEMVINMLEADKSYRASLSKVEKMRTQTEQLLFQHYEEMESLELERIQTIKHAFISMAASLSNTIPRCKETFDNMMLYQETLKPDKDVQFIVEQYRTGQFCPKPILYENYFYGTSTDQLFGVPLEDITRVQESLVPQLISQGLTVIESGFSKLHDEEKNVVWTASLPLDRVHAAREEINWSKPLISIDKLQKFDLLLLASLIRLYLLELPECLFTFELYEPCKLLYTSQLDQDIRLTSISKLLATLPTANYNTVMRLFGHFHKVMKELKSNTHFATTLAKSFSYILMRPQTETKVSIHERHSQKLLNDLIQHYDTIFTEAAQKAQEENSNRPCIICPVKSNSLDETSSIQSSHSSTNSYKQTSARSSSSSSLPRRASILSTFMKSSQSTPTHSIRSNGSGSMIIPMPSASTLFEDPDEWLGPSSESSSLKTPPQSTSGKRSYSIDRPKKRSNEIQDHFMMEELASLDYFFEDEE